jgi:predicted  nucleic acid-binding Zn-ribbon protein
MGTTDEYARKLGDAIRKFMQAYGIAARYIGPMKGYEKVAEGYEAQNEKLEALAKKAKNELERIKDERTKLAYQKRIEEIDRTKSATDHKLTSIRAEIANRASPAEDAKRKMKNALIDIKAYAEKIEASLD